MHYNIFVFLLYASKIIHNKIYMPLKYDDIGQTFHL